MNALLDETRTERLDLGMSFLPQLRVSPTVRAMLLEAKPANQSWADFATEAMVVRALLTNTIGLSLHNLNRQVVRLIGPSSDERQEVPAEQPTHRTPVSHPDKPTQMSLRTAIVEARRSR